MVFFGVGVPFVGSFVGDLGREGTETRAGSFLLKPLGPGSGFRV